ncbi:hypothetical protein EW026_g834 [Hermanssonia centrifuga]|uniref:GH16 domain-containing protein n=1 Tax=Hermanssonia centrifuga TaxID=98765 RepID=A0A4S4KTH3_9APHY|nr:hypothetical protein EW026_g834 [Hermanssonia centrifuga]
MAYRRSSGRAYSSADAYRSLHNPAYSPTTPTTPASPPSSNSHAHHSSSSEEEAAHLTSPMPRSASPSQEDHYPNRDNSPLSPPRPFFLANSKKQSSDRNSWSTNDSLEPASDSDKDTAGDAGSIGVLAPTAGQRSANASSAARRSRANTAGSSGVVRPRNHHRRRSSDATVPASPTVANMAGVGASAAIAANSGRNPFDTPLETPTSARAPPSAFPFLSHAGNPDPGTPIPGVSALGRRTSHESFRRNSINHGQGQGVVYPNSPSSTPAVVDSALRGSMDISPEEEDLARPYAPFMGEGGVVGDRQSWVSNTANGNAGGSVYKNSAAAAMSSTTALATLGEGGASLPRTSSQPQIAMRAPFLSPASRPTSSLWSPPSYPSLPHLNTPGQHLTSTYPPSLTYLPSSSSSNPYLMPRKSKPLMPSSRLPTKLSADEKPWMRIKGKRERLSWWFTFFMMFLGVGVSAAVIYINWIGVHLLKDSDVCLVLDENFNNGGLDTNTWVRDVEMGGFGNGEFEIATASDDNLVIRNNQLYIIPTLTSDEIGTSAIFSGSYDLGSACTVGSDQSTFIGGSSGVKSARISTKGHYSIAYGRVEVRAKLPTGDWLWPAIWMLPENNTYGGWPLSGEIDIMEARGNGPSYPAQGNNFVRSSLNYGVLNTLQTHIVGWWQEKRFNYAEDFHIYGFEWTPDWMRFYVDSRLQAMMNLKITGKGGHSFFDRGDYPAVAHNGSDAEVAIENIWANAGAPASGPFDQSFYLILDLAAGGTSGWFPDNVGGKPWFDGAETAQLQFAQNQSVWSKTWPTNDDDKAFRIDYVKMWKLKSGGHC